MIKNKIIMPDTPRHYYFAKNQKFIKNSSKFKILEIGGAMEGLQNFT